MVIAFPACENERTARAMLCMLIEQGSVNESVFSGKSVFSALLDDWQIDLLSCYGSAEENLEDSDSDEDEAAL